MVREARESSIPMRLPAKPRPRPTIGPVADFTCGLRLERTGSMILVLFQTIPQTISTTLQWLGFFAAIRASTGPSTRRSAWTVGSAVISAAWFIGIVLLASIEFFNNDALLLRIPFTPVIKFAFGYLLLLSGTFRASLAAIPQRWLIGVQTIGGLLLIQYFRRELLGLFAIPAGVGDLLAGS